VLLKRIIPCLDVDRGRVVKGVRYVNLVDAGDPVEAARLYDEQEADELTFLDITGQLRSRGAPCSMWWRAPRKQSACPCASAAASARCKMCATC